MSPGSPVNETVRAGSLDPATRHIYRRADAATLLALLPELRRLTKRTEKEIEQVRLSVADDVDTDAVSAATVPEADFAEHLFSYARDVTDRERWVRDELKRRGLLPLWPGELEYLDEDG